MTVPPDREWLGYMVGRVLAGVGVQKRSHVAPTAATVEATTEVTPTITTADHVAEYWTDHNVTNHHQFASAEESLAYLQWRNCQYKYFIEHMPVAGFDGKVILDYGCGPGHDLLGFAVHSKPARLIGMDVSKTSLEEARSRLATCHAIAPELVLVDPSDGRLPLEDASIDIVRCCGVLHHVPNPCDIMQEFRRILRPDGRAQVMVYNYHSVFVHLYIAYQRMLLDGAWKNVTLREAFVRSTDGPDCPISDCYTPAEFIVLARTAGLTARLHGVAISAFEMSLLPKRWEALIDKRLNSESRQFLHDLTLNCDGIPCYDNHVAGVDGCFELKPA